MKIEGATPQRIILISNRLPFTVVERDGVAQFNESAGGVASGLHSLLQSVELPAIGKTEYLWIGWPGGPVSQNLRDSVESEAQHRFHARPVFLSEADIEAFYSGFCNKTIWPLFHYFPLSARYQPEYWAQYKEVNRLFSEAALAVLRPGDLLWIHDYHLMLLPGLIRRHLPHLSIGFFLHIPFPHYEVFRLLPAQWRRELLEGVLGADLVGFHTFDYAQYFLRCVLRILGYENEMGRLLVQERKIKVAAFPMGIPFDKFAAAAQRAEVGKEKGALRRSLENTKVILSIDRQDYSKGILHRLEGFETLLESNPGLHGQVTLLMVVVPSRIGVEDYDRMKKQIEELVGKINGKFGSVGWTPILYQYRSLSFENLIAIYAIADVALITPLRDGMNLIAKEYVACRTDKTGVLVLSEMAGAAREMGEAVIINPNNREEIARALEEALAMPAADQRKRMEILQRRLRRFDLARWAKDFLTELMAVKPSRDRSLAKLLGAAEPRHIIEHFRSSTRRLILLDYDGTLVPMARRPELAVPPRSLIELMSCLAADAHNELVIISGRKRSMLQNYFGTLPVGIAAEYGAWYKKRGQEWRLIKAQTGQWKIKLLPLLEMYADRLPGAFVEEKEFSLVWHYRDADSEQGTMVARELTDDLLSFTGNIDVQVVQRNKTVEVRNTGIGKAAAARLWLAERQFDFVIAIGDDADDEEIFRVLPSHAYSIRVGITSTMARFNVREPKEVVELLTGLAQAGIVHRAVAN